MTPEGKIQKYAKDRFEAIGGLVHKLSYEGRSGAPDLLVILLAASSGSSRLRKTKTRNQTRTSYEHERMRKRGANVFVVGSKKQVDKLIEHYYI